MSQHSLHVHVKGLRLCLRRRERGYHKNAYTGQRHSEALATQWVRRYSVRRLVNTYSPPEVIAGRPYLDWIYVYWQSFLFNDKKRASYPIYPIPGNLGPHNVDKHMFRVPHDKPILLSPINWISVYKTEADEDTARHEVDIIDKSKIDMTLDKSIQLRDQCHRSGPLIFPLGKRRWGVTDGYWLFIKSLEPGEHRIDSFGTCRSGQVNVSVCYNISVY